MQDLPMQVGDMVEGFQKKQKQYRVKWCSPMSVISADIECRSILVTGKDGIEEVQPEIHNVYMIREDMMVE